MALTGAFLSVLLLLLLATSPLAGAASQDITATFMKIKEQFGNLAELSDWQPWMDYCGYRQVYCGPDHRVHQLIFRALNFSSTIPPAIGELDDLRTLNIELMPGLRGSIPPSFGNLSHLEVLEITFTSVSGLVPGFLSQTNLTSLTLSNNNFSGAIPGELAGLPYLIFLDMSNNSLTGPIPPGLLHAALGVPLWLILHDNQLNGTIPKDYGRPEFDTVNVAHNQLKGNPSFLFGREKRSVNINLSWNRFRFNLTPAKFPDTLRFLDLRHNRIVGRVPVSLRDVRVALFNVSYNELCGEIPTGGYMSWHGADAYLHNRCLCGDPLPPCT